MGRLFSLWPRKTHRYRMMKFVLFSCLISLGMAALTKNDLTCTLCVDIVTDLDTWLTADATEAEIVDFVKGLCAAVGTLLPDLEGTCNLLIESQLPSIIDGLVNDNLNPQEVCDAITACP